MRCVGRTVERVLFGWVEFLPGQRRILLVPKSVQEGNL